MRYLSAGQGDPLVGLHGAGGLRLGRAHALLAERYRVMLFEAPGFGQSPVNERSQSMSDLAATMLQAVANLGIEQFNLIGNSFGGTLALCMALQQPERIQAMVLVAPAAMRPESDTLPRPTSPEERMALLYAHPERQPTAASLDPAMITKHQTLVRRLMGPPRDEALENRLPDLHVPVLVLFGTLDRMIPSDMGHLYCEKLPNCSLVLVYDALVTDLLTTPAGRIQGVRAQTPEGVMDIQAGAVVLACGGFEASPKRRVRHLGAEWQQVRVRGTRHNTGELLECVEALGAKIGGHLHGAHAVPVDASAPEVGDLHLGDLTARLSYPLGIMVNREAQRFIDEGMDFKSYSYTVMGPAILRQPGGVAYQIFDQQPVDRLEARYGSGSKPVIAETLEALAMQLGLSPDALVQTVKAYNAAVQDRPFDPTIKDGKGTQGIAPAKTNWALRLEVPPFVAYRVCCGITFTYGGVITNSEGAGLRHDGSAIPGLYAAGEVQAVSFTTITPVAPGSCSARSSDATPGLRLQRSCGTPRGDKDTYASSVQRMLRCAFSR